MPLGLCSLCGDEKELIESHVWPAWAYKRFASELNRGGRFLRLDKGELDNQQEKYSWFCHDCDSGLLGDREGAALSASIEKAPSAPVTYEEAHLRFAASISLRTAMAQGQRKGQPMHRKAENACRAWRDYLLGNTGRPDPYSLHIFVLHGHPLDRHEALGGNVFGDLGFVFSQIGYLWIFGLLDPTLLTTVDFNIWQRSKLSEAGGVLTPRKDLELGQDITQTAGEMLRRLERYIHQRAGDIVPRLGDRIS